MALKTNSGEYWVNNKRFAVVFQEDRLLQHRTARQNVEIPLIGRTQIEKTNVHKIAGTALRDVELNGFEDFSVRELSGGMCRRVALARAIAICKKRIGQRCRNSR